MNEELYLFLMVLIRSRFTTVNSMKYLFVEKLIRFHEISNLCSLFKEMRTVPRHMLL